MIYPEGLRVAFLADHFGCAAGLGRLSAIPYRMAPSFRQIAVVDLPKGSKDVGHAGVEKCAAPEIALFSFRGRCRLSTAEHR